MNKTISINLSGMLFNLEEAAFEKLSKYLSAIKASFHGADGRDEIIGDIESRIAELFQEKLKNRQVVLLLDVEEVISVMGQPEDYREEQPEAQAEPQASKQAEHQQSYDEYAGPKRLFRAPDEGMIGGVCVGLGHYFGIDPVWLRIAFLAAFFIAGGGILIYIILWIVLPKAESTAEKLQMRGEPVNISNIEKSIREEINRLQGKTGEFAQKARNSGSSATNFLNEFFESLLRLIRQIVAFMGKSLGIFFLGLGSVLLLVWLSIVLSGGYGINISTNDEVSNFSIQTFLSAFFSDPDHLKIFLTGLAMFTIAPIISLLLFGLRLITRKGLLSGWPATVNGTVFTIGLILMVVTAALMLTEFKSKGKIIEPVGIVQPMMSDTLEIKILQDALPQLKNQVDFDNWKFYLDEEEPPFMVGEADLEVRKSDNDQIRVQVTKQARGETKKSAITSASGINTFLKQENNVLWMNPYFTLKNGLKWRNQHAIFTLFVPEGKFVRFHPGTSEMFTDVPNIQNFEEEELEMEVWKMGKDGLECQSCVTEAQ
jgi:phage shock protein PspC (stress-responsive transcriptional regulator)